MVPIHQLPSVEATIFQCKYHSLFFQSELALWLLAESPSDRPSAQAISTSRVFSELLNRLTPSQPTTTGETHNP